jgi:hypothetical protein
MASGLYFKAFTNLLNLNIQSSWVFVSLLKMSELSPAGASRKKASSSSPKTPRKTARKLNPSTPCPESSTSQMSGSLEIRLDYTCNTPVRDSKNPSVSRDMTSMSLSDRGKQILDKIQGERKTLISDSLCTYYSQDFEVADNAEAVRKLLIKSGTLATGKNPGKMGFVYAIHDHDLKLIKIGSALDVAESKKQLKQKCKITGDLTVIAQSGKMLDYERLEKLIHQDLAPHRWRFDCYHGTSSSANHVTHEKYFDISEEVAKHTFEFWCDVVEQHPWDDHSHEAPKLGTVKLRSDWLDHLKLLETTNLHRPPKPESHGDHDMRMQRWHDALNIGGPQAAELQKCLHDSAGTELLCMSESQYEPGKQESYKILPGRLSTPIEIEEFGEEPKIKTESSTLHSAYQDTSLIKLDSSDQSTSDLLMKMLVTEARPLSARPISADLSQLRWPIIYLFIIFCSSPYNPTAHSLVMCLVVFWSCVMGSHRPEAGREHDGPPSSKAYIAYGFLTFLCSLHQT